MDDMIERCASVEEEEDKGTMDPPMPKNLEGSSSLDRSHQISPTQLKQCQEVLEGLLRHGHGWVFKAPVDPVELGLPDYFEVIKKPMDLGTIKKRLEAGTQYSLEDFRDDVKLTFNNAMTYNEAGSFVHDLAKELVAKFDADYAKMLERIKEEGKMTTCKQPPSSENDLRSSEQDQYDITSLWLPESEQRDEIRLDTFGFDEHYCQTLEQELRKEAEMKDPTASSSPSKAQEEHAQGTCTSHSSAATLSRPPSSDTNHLAGTCCGPSSDDIPQWMKEDSNAVVALAVQNYEKFYGLHAGSIDPHDSGTALFLEGTSAGISGWASACVDSASSPKEGEGASSRSGEDRSEQHESQAPSKSCTMAVFARSDEEESRQLRIAMLESIGARPSCDRGATSKRVREDNSSAWCYSSDDDSVNDFASDNDEGKERGETLTKKLKPSEEVEAKSTKESNDDTASVATNHGEHEHQAGVQNGEEPPPSDDDFVVVQAPPNPTTAGGSNLKREDTPEAERRKHQNAPKAASTTQRQAKLTHADSSVPKVSRASWQWRNVVGHLRGNSSTNPCKQSHAKNNEAESRKDRKTEEHESDSEWSIVEGAEE